MQFCTNERLQTPSFATQPAKILFADKYLYIAHKPYGVTIHPDLAHREETFGNMLATAFGQPFELRIITRLDKTTEGLVLGAFDEVTAQKLNDMQYAHKISKTYHALVEGHLLGCGKIDFSLSRQGNKTVVDANGKSALTFYEEILFDGQNTLAQLQLGTGRTHQIRAHLGAIGHPIVGDKLYGATTGKEVQLRCVQLQFVHPITGENILVALPDSKG